MYPKIYFYFILWYLCVGCDSSISSTEMLEQGKLQYQLLQERANLPKFGSCWKQAVEHIDRGCKSLTEETQSDVALHLANCFLEMSGHATYNCVLDKKPNLRGICVNSMSDRAFNVYTEFYTHTQNICWFLQGQVWQEVMSESTIQMGRALQESAKNQMDLLKNQRYSLELQERLSDYGNALERILVSTVKHQELLFQLQSWIVGEVSWIDTVVFYTSFSLLTFFLTSSRRTAGARLPILFMILVNAILERLLSRCLTNWSDDIQADQNLYYRYVWYIRYLLIFCTAILVIAQMFLYKDYHLVNNVMLKQLQKDLAELNSNVTKIEYIEQIDSNQLKNSVGGKCLILCNNAGTLDVTNNTEYSINNSSPSRSKAGNSLRDYTEFKENILNNTSSKSTYGYKNEMRSSTATKENASISRVHSSTNRRRLLPLMDRSNAERYNLRSRNGTPDSNV